MLPYVIINLGVLFCKRMNCHNLVLISDDFSCNAKTFKRFLKSVRFVKLMLVDQQHIYCH